MTSRRLRAASLLLAVAVLSVETIASPQVSTYAIIDLGTLPGGESSSARDINYSRQVVGVSVVAGEDRPFVWQHHVMTELPLLPGASGGVANSINDRGQIVGTNLVNGSSRAVLWDDGTVVDLGAPPGGFSCSAEAINNRGQIVGGCSLPNGDLGGFLWENGRMTPLGALPGSHVTLPTSINSSGQVVGLAIDAQSEARAFAWQRGRLVDLGEVPGGTGSFAAGINSHGDIVGWSQDVGLIPFAHLWTRGKMVNLGTLPGHLWSQAFAINLHGQVTGRSEGTPFIWTRGDMLALPTLQGASGLGFSINNRGDIAGQADNVNGLPRAVMWTERLRLLREPDLVLDFGPGSGPVTPGVGSGAALFSASNGQNFVDRVFFRRDMEITGLNVFTSSSHLPLLGTHFRVKILRDESGVPGAPLAEFDAEPTSVTFVGEFATSGGQTTDVHRVRLRFNPIHLEGRAAYWVGASGLNFDAGAYGVLGAGDSQMMMFDGSTLIGPAPGFFGDLMFQLVSDPR
jgi:probable HAF family extracellular repeat protein